MVNNVVGPHTRFPASKAQAFHCHIIWPSMKVCLLQVSNVGQCREVKEIIVTLGSLKAAQNSKDTTYPRYTGLIYICSPISISVSFLLLPLFLSWLLSMASLCLQHHLIKFVTLWLNTGVTLWCSHCLSDCVSHLLLLSRSPHIGFQFCDAPGVATRMAGVGQLLVLWELREWTSNIFCSVYLEQKHKTLIFWGEMKCSSSHTYMWTFPS